MKEVTDFFGSVSDRYNRNRVSDSYMDLIIESFRLSPGFELLELGCGPGRISIELARRGVRVTAIDASSTMIALAQSNTDAELVTWTCSPAESLPLGKNKYDAIFSFEALHLMSDLPNLVHRIKQALRPGGAFGIGWLEKIWERTCADLIMTSLGACGVRIKDWGSWSCPQLEREFTVDDCWSIVNTQSLSYAEESALDQIVDDVLVHSYAADLPSSKRAAFRTLMKEGLARRSRDGSLTGITSCFLQHSRRLG